MIYILQLDFDGLQVALSTKTSLLVKLVLNNVKSVVYRTKTFKEADEVTKVKVQGRHGNGDAHAR